jgi:radical SAM protein with 4Fe4S-binding SPASM domain
MTTVADPPASRTPALNPLRQLLDAAEARHQLLTAHWELTHRCNERCTHCYLDVLPANRADPGELTTDEGLRLLAELQELGALNLTLSGGEPLLRRDFFLLAERARTLGFVLRIFTNGLLITPALADRLAALHPYAVEVSIYGADPATHDAITRRPGSFARTTAALGLLAERKVRTVLKVPLMHENIRQFWQVKQLAADLGARFRFDLTLIPKLSGDPAPLRHRLTYADLLWFYRQMLTPARSGARALAPGCRTCNIGVSALVIDPHGAVYPCLETRRSAGNIRAAPLRAIWEQAAVWGEVRSLTIDALPVCSACTLRSLCARCHGLAGLEHGDMRQPATANCVQTLAKRQALLEQGAEPAALPLTPHLAALLAQSGIPAAPVAAAPHPVLIPLLPMP